MARKWNSVIPGAVLFLAVMAGVGLLSSTSSASLSASSAIPAYDAQLPKSDPAARVPAFHKAPPASVLGPTLDPAQFSEVVIQNSYAMAAKVKNVLYQEPCYCFCDQNDGHHSLYDCFASIHASICNTCMAEGIFTYEQTQKGLSPAKIRAAIIRGDWRKMDLNAYKEPVKLN